MEVSGNAQGASEEAQPPSDTDTASDCYDRGTATLGAARSHHSLNDIQRWPSAGFGSSADPVRESQVPLPSSKSSSQHDLTGARLSSNDSSQDPTLNPEDVPLPASRASSLRHEPWRSTSELPPLKEFYSILRCVPHDAAQRLILVEDMSPDLIELFRSTFPIAPHAFEEHLNQSGYMGSAEDQHASTPWNLRSPTRRRHSTVTWYRPVVPLIGVHSRFRRGLIDNKPPPLNCIFEGCKDSKHKLKLRTTNNIWRPHLHLSPTPGIGVKRSTSEYPIAWEERATIWVEELGDCIFVILFLDPLPMVVNPNPQTATNTGIPEPRPAEVWTSQTGAPGPSLASSQLSPVSARQPSLTFLSTAEEDLRENEAEARSTRLVSSSRNSGNAGSVIRSTAEGDLQGNETRAGSSRVFSSSRNSGDTARTSLRQRLPQQGHAESLRTTSNANTEAQRSENYVEGGMFSFSYESTLQSIHAPQVYDRPFVPYLPSRARSSALVSPGNTSINENLMRSGALLQKPPSTLDDYERLLPGWRDGTGSSHDPLPALFKIIDDDTVGLTEILRVSLQRIGQGTLEEDMMQKRLPLWRSLLHKCKFKLLDIDHQLSDFVHFAYNEILSSTGTSTVAAVSWNGTNSREAIMQTQRILKTTAEQVDKASESLRMEMQIVESRRSITEAESVAKLTELAFVFIPLSFAASLFGMQIRELESGAPLYAFVIVALTFTFLAYGLRLTVRSSRIIEWKEHVFEQIREKADLSENEPIPTHIFLMGLGQILGPHLASYVLTSTSLLLTCAAIVAIIGAILSPIILLWLRALDKGFSTAITILLVILEGTLVGQAISAVYRSDEFSWDFTSWRKGILRAQRQRKEIRKRRRKKRKKGGPVDEEELESNDGAELDLGA